MLQLEDVRRIAAAFRDGEGPEAIVLPPDYHTAWIGWQIEFGAIDRWEGWRRLHNMGLRGATLSDAAGLTKNGHYLR